MNRKGAFWEDRYHATAIESDGHIIQCIVYLSRNMVRAGMVDRPVKWKKSGYYEIKHSKNRYAIIDYTSLLKILGIETLERLQDL